MNLLARYYLKEIKAVNFQIFSIAFAMVMLIELFLILSSDLCIFSLLFIIPLGYFLYRMLRRKNFHIKKIFLFGMIFFTFFLFYILFPATYKEGLANPYDVAEGKLYGGFFGLALSTIFIGIGLIPNTLIQEMELRYDYNKDLYKKLGLLKKDGNWWIAGGIVFIVVGYYSVIIFPFLCIMILVGGITSIIFGICLRFQNRRRR